RVEPGLPAGAPVPERPRRRAGGPRPAWARRAVDAGRGRGRSSGQVGGALVATWANPVTDHREPDTGDGVGAPMPGNGPGGTPSSSSAPDVHPGSDAGPRRAGPVLDRAGRRAYRQVARSKTSPKRRATRGAIASTVTRWLVRSDSVVTPVS